MTRRTCTWAGLVLAIIGCGGGAKNEAASPEQALAGGVRQSAPGGATAPAGGAGAASPPLASSGGMGGARAGAGAALPAMPPTMIPVGGAPNPAPAMGPTMCDGKELPERARGTPGPYKIGPEAAGLPPYFPTADWQKLDPAMLGFDPAKLDEALKYNPDNWNTEALLVIRHGYIAAEQYFGSFTQNSRHQSFSMAKSFSSALVGILIEQGKISGVDEKLCKFYPQQWKCDDPSDKHGLITIHHALTLTTGLQWQEDWRTNKTGSNDSGTDLLQAALRKPVVDEPGTNVRYSSADPALLRGVVEETTGMGVLAFARSVMLDAIGLSGLQWGGDTYFGIQATAREYAKFGYLYLNRGLWDGKQIVPAKWVDDSTRALNDKDPDPDPDVCRDWYYYLWHINLPNRLGSGVNDPNCATQFCISTRYANLPPDGYFAEGLAGQYIFVVPSADLVMVRLGNDGFSGIERWDAWIAEVLEKVLASIR